MTSAEEGSSTWDGYIGELARRRAMALEMGGPDKVARQHENGRLTIRERIDLLLDKGSFREVGPLSGIPNYDDRDRLLGVVPANLVCGRGTIAGRPVAVSGDDFTIRGGSAEATLLEKATFAVRLALEYRMPLVQLVDGSGGGGGVKMYEQRTHGTAPPIMRDWEYAVAALGVVPIAAMVGGSVAGMGALKVCHSHYSVMVKETSQVFAAGPPLVRYTREEVSKEDLGGSKVQTRNGVVSDEAEDEADALRRLARFLSYLPSSAFELPPIEPCADPADGRQDWLLNAIPHRRRAFDVRRILEAVVDEGSFFEMSRYFGRPIVTGLARLAGKPVAIVASDPKQLGGGLNAAACQKLRRFIDMANTFHLPRVGFYDVPGLMIGSEAEAAGTLRFAAEAISAIQQTTIPHSAVILRRFFGLGAAAQINPNVLTPIYAWPSGQWGSMPFEGGIEAAYRAELEGSVDPEALRADIEQRLAYARSPFRAAERFGITDLIDPRDTRRLVCEFVEDAYRTLRPRVLPTAMRP